MSYFTAQAISHFLTGAFWGFGFWTPVALYLIGRWSVSRLRRTMYGR